MLLLGAADEVVLVPDLSGERAVARQRAAESLCGGGLEAGGARRGELVDEGDDPRGPITSTLLLLLLLRLLRLPGKLWNKWKPASCKLRKKIETSESCKLWKKWKPASRASRGKIGNQRVVRETAKSLVTLRSTL